MPSWMRRFGESRGEEVAREARERAVEERNRERGLVVSGAGQTAVMTAPTSAPTSAPAFIEMHRDELAEYVRRRGPGAFLEVVERAQRTLGDNMRIDPAVMARPLADVDAGTAASVAADLAAQINRQFEQAMSMDWGTLPVFVPPVVIDEPVVRIVPEESYLRLEHRIEAALSSADRDVVNAPTAPAAVIAGVEYDFEPATRMLRARDGSGSVPYATWARMRRGPLKEPTTIALGAGEAVDAEYAALAAELNIAAGARERFRALVAARGLCVYNTDEVTEYLHHKYGVPRGNLTREVVWGWRPLREEDRIEGEGLRGYNGVVQTGAAPYIKPIPFPVLLTVRAIASEFPMARMFVSDEMQGERIPDPFLLVQLAGESYVVERWDEPAFRPKA